MRTLFLIKISIQVCLITSLIFLVSITLAAIPPCNSANSQTNSVSACTGCSVMGANNAVDNNTNTSSTLTVVSGKSGYVEQMLIFPVKGSAGDSVRIAFLFPGKVINNSFVSNISVVTYNGNVSNNDLISIISPAVDLHLTPVDDNAPVFLGQFAIVSFAPQKEFDRVQVRMNASTLKQFTSAKILYANHHVPKPVVDNPVVYLCSGQSKKVSIESPEGAIFKWYKQPTGGLSVYIGNSMQIEYGYQDIVYYVESTKNGCTNPNRTVVKIYFAQHPELPTVKGAYICSGQSATISASSPGSAIKWYMQPTGGISIKTNTTLVTPALSSNTIYYAEAMNRAGCYSTHRAPTPVTVLKPNQPIIKWSKGFNDAIIKSIAPTTGGYLIGQNNGNIRLLKVDESGVLLWEKNYGGTAQDGLISILPASDGGFILAGNTQSNNGDITDGNNGLNDIWIVKINANGQKLWDKTYGGSGDESLVTILPAADGGYFLAGISNSSNGDISNGNNGGNDYLLMKINPSGVKLWDKTFGGNKDDLLRKAVLTSDGGVVLSGTTTSTNGDVSGSKGMKDFWLVKVNSAGNHLWSKSIGGNNDDELLNIVASSDGACVVAGTTLSNNGDVTGYHGQSDILVVKLNSSGTKQWAKSLGGSSTEFTYGSLGLIRANDGGYIVAGVTSSSDGNVSVFKGYEDTWLVKLDELGTIKWNKSYGGEDFDNFGGIMATSDGGYLIGVSTRSRHGDITTLPHELGDFYDIWIVKTDVNGNIAWDGTYGGYYDDYFSGMLPSSDGGYLIIGGVESDDGDVEEKTNTNWGGWVFKLGNSMCGASSSKQEDLFHLTSVPVSNKNEHSTSFPYPFRDTLNLKIELEKRGLVIIQMYSEKGVEVARYNENREAGIHEILLNTKEIIPGLYLCKIRFGEKEYQVNLIKH